MKFVAKKREAAGTNASKKLRQEDLVPGVVYASDLEPINISMERADVELIERELGINSVFELEVEGGETRTVFLRDISRAALKPIIYNVNLQAIKKGEKLEMDIPVYIENEDKLANPDGVAALNFFEVTVDIDPATAPEYIVADVEGLDIGENITVGDLTFEGIENAEILTDPEEVIVSIAVPTEEAEVDEEVVEAEPEVINEKEAKIVEEDD